MDNAIVSGSNPAKRGGGQHSRIRSTILKNFKFKLQLLTAEDVAEVELPELARESEAGPALIQIDDELQTQGSPQVCQRNVSADRLQSHLSVERENLPFGDEAIEGIAVEVVAVGWVGGPVRIGIMRSRNLDAPAGSGDAKKFCDKRHHVGHVLGDVTTDDFIELVVCKRIGKNTEIVDYIGVGARVCIDANRAWRLVPATTDVKNSFLNHR